MERPFVRETGALVVIAAFVLASHVWFVPHGVCFNDPSVYYHFGHRLLSGAVPYRDYVFQVGPLPIYVDALFQKLFGSTYVASLWAALTIKILRLWVVWLVATRVSGRLAGSLLTVFFALSPIFAFSYHWSTPYAQLFIETSALFFVLAARSERHRLRHLALAGASRSERCACRDRSSECSRRDHGLAPRHDAHALRAQGLLHRPPLRRALGRLRFGARGLRSIPRRLRSASGGNEADRRGARSRARAPGGVASRHAGCDSPLPPEARTEECRAPRSPCSARSLASGSPRRVAGLLRAVYGMAR